MSVSKMTARELGDDGAVWNVILMPVHVKEEFADLIEASPAARFCPGAIFQRTRLVRRSAITVRSTLSTS